MKFGISNNVRSRVVRECTPELFNGVLDAPVVRMVCAEIADAREMVARGVMQKEEFEAKKAELKKRLPVFTFHATFPGGRRKNDDAVPSGLAIYDLDHIPNPRAKWDEIEARKEQLGIVLAHVSPSTEGLRLVFVIPQGMTLPEAQAWMASQLGDAEYDACVKDLARCSFAVPRGYVLWMSPSLFGSSEVQEIVSKECRRQECRSVDNSFDSEEQEESASSAQSASEKLVGESEESASEKLEEGETMQAEVSSTLLSEASLLHSCTPKRLSFTPEKLTYHGLDSSEIVQKYWELNNDGQPPTQGDRNTKIFDLACSLRHIFNFDRELLNRAIPNYDGFPQEEKMQCIDNAIREPRKYMPMKLTRVLQALKAEHADRPELVQALDTVEQETMQYYAKKLPKRMGLGVDEVRKWLPQELHMQALVSMAPALGTLLTRVRLDVHGDVNTLNLQSFIVGEAGSGKSRFARIDAALMREFYAESIANQRLNEQHRREKERKKNAKEVPVFDMLPERCIPARHSVAQVLDMLNSNGGLHCYTFAEEADIMSGNGRQAFADTSAIRRVAYDASSYAQAYKSDTASRLTIERVLWNLTQCGTPDALYRAYRNFTDGELSRVAIARMPDNTFTPLIASRPFGDRESLPLEQLGRLLPLMEGDVKLEKLEKHVVERIESFRLECLKNFDRVAARTRLRIPVTTMRMVCAFTCCRLASMLVEKIDKAKKKPSWADGAKSAEEYLKSHPNGVANHLTKMQDEEMMALYDTLSEYLTDTQLYYFRSRIEQAYESDNYKVDGRTRRGKNDSVFERLPQKFDLRQAASAKGHATADAVIRTMVYQWCKQGLTMSIGNGLYRKV